MKIEDFIARIEEEYEDLKPGTLIPDSIFREVFEWNSINAEDIATSKTIEDLYKIIMARIH